MPEGIGDDKVSAGARESDRERESEGRMEEMVWVV